MKNENKLSKIDRALNKIKYVGSVASATLAFATPTFAAGELNTNVSQGSVINAIAGAIANIFLVVGILLLLVSVAQLVMAFRNEDPEGKAKAAQQLAVSIVLIGIKFILNLILAAVGVEGVQ